MPLAHLVWLCRSGGGRIKRVIRFWRMDAIHPAGTEWRLLRQGFFSYRRALYPFDHYDRRWFLNDWVVENHFSRINPPAVLAQMNDKLYFHLLLQALGLGHVLAPLVGLLVDGEFTPLSVHRTLGDALGEHGRLVAKPVGGTGGKGVQLVESTQGFPHEGTYLVEGALRQHSYSAAIFPGSVNTLRLMTLRANAQTEPFISGAAHRFGVLASAPVDNFSRGGVFCGVDLQTGELTAARSAVGRLPKDVHTHHPDTGAPFVGVKVPHWEEVKAFALSLARAIPGLKMSGWDVCVTEAGPRLIEANGSVPNPELFQAFRPILLDRATREFFAEQNVIPRGLADELDRVAIAEKRA